MKKSVRCFQNLKGQGIIEYLLLFTIVILVLIFFFRRQSPFSKAYNGVVADQGEMIINITETIFDIE